MAPNASLLPLVSYNILTSRNNADIVVHQRSPPLAARAAAGPAARQTAALI